MGCGLKAEREVWVGYCRRSRFFFGFFVVLMLVPIFFLCLAGSLWLSGDVAPVYHQHR